MKRCNSRASLRRRVSAVALVALAGLSEGVSVRAASFVPFVSDSTHIATAAVAAAKNVPASAGVVYDASGKTNDIQIVNFGTVVYTGAVDVTSTLNRIRMNDSVHNNESDDGGFFNFNSDELPDIPRMGANYYMEFMVWPNMNLAAGTYDTSAKPYPGVTFPGPMRLLIGSSGEVYFTGDHYATNDYVNPTTPPTALTIDSWSANSGTWSGSGNWSLSSVPASGQAAYLTSGDNSSRTITYNYTGAAITLADLLVNSDGSSSNPGSMTLNQSQYTLTTQREEIWARYATAAVNQSGGTHTVLGALQLGELIASVGNYALSGSGILSAVDENVAYTTLPAGAGTATFTQGGGTQTISDAINIGCAAGGSGTYRLSLGALSAGTVNLYAGGQFSQSGGSFTAGTLSVNAGGNVTITGGSQTITNLQLSGGGKMSLSAGGNKVLKLATIAASGASSIDLADNKLVVTSTSLADVTSLIASGRDGGSWNGPGIITSQTYAKSPSILTTLAVANAGDVSKTTFGGVSVSQTDTLVMYTYAGDANLDGRINGDDYFAIDSHVNSAGASGYENGDFNYDGHINGDDYFIIDSNINQQTLGVFSASAPVSGAVLSDVSAVPEPGSVGMILASGMIGLSRKRRRVACEQRVGD